MSLPDLHNLTVYPRKEIHPGGVKNGVYCLDTKESLNPCESSIVYQRNALPALDGEFKEAADFMRNEVRDDSFMGNPVKRKQCTFGPLQYKNYQLVSDRTMWPQLVGRVLSATVQFAKQLGVDSPDEYNAVHANFYPDGDASVVKHADDEVVLIPGAPIFSYTYIHGKAMEGAREFTIWRMPKGADHVEGKGKLADITLYSGDLLIMQGDMQKYFQHSIEKKTTPVHPRLNFTVRKFVSRKEAMARQKAKLNAPATVWNPNFASQLLGPTVNASALQYGKIIEYSRALLRNIPDKFPTAEEPHALSYPMLTRLRRALANDKVCQMAQTVLSAFSVSPTPSAEDKRLLWMSMSYPAVPKDSTFFAEIVELLAMLYMSKFFFQPMDDKFDQYRMAWKNSLEQDYFATVSAYIYVRILRRIEGYLLNHYPFEYQHMRNVLRSDLVPKGDVQYAKVQKADVMPPLMPPLHELQSACTDIMKVFQYANKHEDGYNISKMDWNADADTVPTNTHGCVDFIDNNDLLITLSIKLVDALKVQGQTRTYTPEETEFLDAWKKAIQMQQRIETLKQEMPNWSDVYTEFSDM